LPVSPVMFSSASDEWSTPQDLWDRLNKEFRFTVDVAASHENAKCSDYLDSGDDALVGDWVGFGDRCWCNPPYSRGLQGKFIAKAAEQREYGVMTVMLLPARTDTKAFHAHIYDASTWQARPGVEIRLLPGRLKFGGAVNSAPFPSMIVIFRPGVS
jgi:phage N-6-adenine-methyltransferase